MLWSGSTAVMATVALLATVSPSGAISLPWLANPPEQDAEMVGNSARNFQPQVEQGVYLNTFSSALLNLLSSLNMVQMTHRYPVQSDRYQAHSDGYPMHPEAKLGGVGVIIPSGSVSVSKNITYGNVGIGIPDVTGGLAAFLALCAAVGAGLAALIAFVIPPLQIANQILAIIAIALLVAYIIEDKHYKPKDYKDYDDDSSVYSVYEYTGNYASDGYGSSGYGSNGYDGYSSGYDPPSKGYDSPSKGYNRDDDEESVSSSSYAQEKSDKYGSPYSPPYSPPVKTAPDNSRPPDKKTTAAPEGKPDPYTAVFPYMHSKEVDLADSGRKNSQEESNLVASGEERRSMVSPSLLNGIGRMATAAIVGLGSIYDDTQ